MTFVSECHQTGNRVSSLLEASLLSPGGTWPPSIFSLSQKSAVLGQEDQQALVTGEKVRVLEGHY